MAAPVLVGDIGGTNARFGLAEPGQARPRLHQLRVLATAEFASLQQAARHYLAQVAVRPTRAALAVACPVRGDDIRLTNRAWAFNRSELAATLGLEELRILNDFGAAALGVGALEASEYELLHGHPGQALADPVSVIGPGTGMGVALLLRGPDRGWQVIETEGGHVSFAPLGSQERRIHDWLAARHGRVSIERVLSGRGLSEIHAALNAVPPAKRETPDPALRAPADILAAALSGEDSTARAALARFCAILGSVAGDAALFHGARTVAIAGGIVPRFIPFLRSSAFRERFLDKGRFAAHLEGVNVLVVTHPEPGLLGAALSLAAPAPQETCLP
ncbi:MAG: glucokinase [Wenzhouxiangella sp.]|nr:MAG: glucokinase [Wenzhouxiangella sp.]